MKEENGTVEKSNADDKQKRKRLETTQGETGRNKEKRVNQKKCTHSGYDKNFVGLHFLEWDGFLYGVLCFCVLGIRTTISFGSFRLTRISFAHIFIDTFCIPI